MTEAKQVDTTKLQAEILAGRHDAALQDLLVAVRKRVTDSDAMAWRWRITLDGETWTEDEVTLAELQVVERITGDSWLTLNPYRSAAHLAAFMFARLVRVAGMAEADARAKVDGLTLAEIAGAVEQYVARSAGKDDPPASTTS